MLRATRCGQCEREWALRGCGDNDWRAGGNARLLGGQQKKVRPDVESYLAISCVRVCGWRVGNLS